MVGTNDSSNENVSYLRKVRKPMVEKKRRDRMNHSISLLKLLIADTIQHQTVPLTRLDKADILELTVNHLTRVQQQQRSVALATEVAAYNKGFKECARVAVTYLQNDGRVSEDVEKHASSHLHQAYLSRNQQYKTQHSHLRHQDVGHVSMDTTGQDVTNTQVHAYRLSTPLRDDRFGLTQGINTPTFSPILDPNTSLPHLSGSFVRSSLEFTPNSSSSSSSSSYMSTSGSSISGSDEERYSSRDETDDCRHVVGKGVVTIGNSVNDKVGHVIKETTWRPW